MPTETNTGIEYPVMVGPWRLRTREAGSGPPVVLVHGLGTSRASWARNFEALAACSHVYALDLPGFGDSDRPRRPLSPRQLAEVLAGWLAAVGLERASFVGHSLGGEVCLWLAARHPERVERLVLAASTGGRPGVPVRHRFWRLLKDGLREPFDFLPTLLRAYWQAGWRRIFHTASRSDPHRLHHALPQVQAPTLVLWGAGDPVVTLDESRRLCEALSGARLEVIEEGAHGLIFDAPEPFNRAVCEFLQLDTASRAPEGARPDPR